MNRIFQFVLWKDCNHQCEFCYYKKTKRITTQQEKINNINKTIESIKHPDFFQQETTIGLIGGELFDGQLEGIHQEWNELLKNINNSLVKRVWLATSLMYLNLHDLETTIDFLEKEIVVCTSWDVEGRFCDNQEEIWRENIEYLKKTYPHVKIHVTVILTQDFINEFDTFDFPEEIDSFNFIEPQLYLQDNLYSKQDYNNNVKQNLNEYPFGFFIEDRKSFLEFCYKLYKKYGIQSLKNFIEPTTHSSDIIEFDEEYSELLRNRWNTEKRDYRMKCGHTYSCCCYVNSHRCVMCDVEEIIKSLGK